MARTNVKGTQVLDGSVGRVDLNTLVSGSAVITKLITNNGVAITGYTGADSGTGDVTVAADLTFLDTKYASIVTSRTQNHVLAAPSSGNGAAAFRALVAGDIPAIAISGVTGLQTALDGKWTKGGDALSNTTAFGSTNNYNIQLIHNNVLAATIRSDGFADIKRLVAGRGPGAFDTFEAVAAFGGNVIIGGWNSAAQNSYDLNMVAHTTQDNPNNASRKNRIKFGYYSGADFANRYKRSIEYLRSDDSLVIGSFSSVISDTSTTTPAEASSIYIASDGSTSIGQASKESMKFLVSGAVRFKSTLDVTTSVTSPMFIGGTGTASVLALKATTGVGGSSSYLSFLVGNNGDVEAMRINNTGHIGFGTAGSSAYNIRLVRDFLQSTSLGISSEGIAQIATTTVTNFNSIIGTGSDANPSTIRHFYAQQNATWVGSATTQIGFGVSSNLTGSVNTYAFRSGIGAGSGRWNIYMDGTANNYVAGSFGVGTNSLTGYNMRISKAITGATESYGLSVVGVVQPDVTIAAYFNTTITGVASGATLPNLYGSLTAQGAYSGATVTNQYAYYVNSSWTGASTLNVAYRAAISAGTGRWNIYMDGSASNYLAGKLGIGTTSLTSDNIRITLPLTGNATYYGVSNLGVVQSDVSYAVYYRSSASTAAASYTVGNLIHYGAYRGTIGAGSSINYQYGVYIDSTLIGAGTGNYGIFSAIPSGGVNWNLYMAGSATNYLNGSLWIGTTTGSYKLDVSGTGHFTGVVQFDSIPTCSINASSSNHLVNYATLQAYTAGIKFDPLPVKTVALSNITLSGHQTINGYTTSGSTDRVLVAGQSTPSQNGVYIASSGSWTRDTNFNTEAEIKGFIHTVSNGSKAGYKYINTNQGTITVDTTDITYAEFSSVTETDPIFTAHVANGITSTLITQWNTAYTLASALTTTNALAEGGTNLYFTEARVRATIITGYSVGSNTALAATDTVLQAFQKLQGQINNRLVIGGNTSGADIAVGTNDAFDFNLKRNDATQLAIKSGVIEANFDFDVKGKLKLNGSTGVDHQFVKYNGTNTVWSTLDTGELSDKNDIVMLQDIAGERGFQLFSDSAKTYADAFFFTNSIAGIALGIHGYTNDAIDTVKEFGIQLDTDGYLYHRKLDGSRSKIATVDMVSGGGTWNGGYVSNNISFPVPHSLDWGKASASDIGASISVNYDTLYSPTNAPSLSLFAKGSTYINANEEIRLSSKKQVGLSIGIESGVVIDGVMLDLQDADDIAAGGTGYAKLAVSLVTSGSKTMYVAKLVSM